MMSESLADYLQIWGIENDLIVFADGSIGFAFDLMPLDVSCASDDNINELAQRTMHFLNSLPIGIDAQFIQDIKSGNATVIEQHGKLSHTSENSVASMMTEQRCKRLRGVQYITILSGLTRPSVMKPRQIFMKKVSGP